MSSVAPARRRRRPAPAAVVLVAAAGCLLALAVTGCSRSSAAGGAAAPGLPPGPTFTVLQMNLCLSGMAPCYDPGVVDEAVARIRQLRPDAVTLSEACRADVARIARRTGLHLRFSRVVYAGARLPCIDPGGRGLFGDAVLTEAVVEHAETADFGAQAGLERRRWLCVTTRAAVDVCTAHLNTRTDVEVTGNDGQCAELRRLLARRAGSGAVIFGGDMNRLPSCAPAGVWTVTDAAGSQAPGLQHVYGSRALRSPVGHVVPAEHTDHDLLVVRARLAAGR